MMTSALLTAVTGRAKVMGLREIHSAAHIDDPRLQCFGKLHQQPDAVLGARRTIDDDHRLLRVGEQPRRLLHCASLALRRRSRRIASECRVPRHCCRIGCCWRPASSAIMTGP